MINKNILKQAEKSGLKEEELYESYKIFFGTLVSEPRLRILNSLKKGEKNVSQLIEELGMDQTAVSHNLARLRNCGFITLEKKGKYHYYKLNEKTIKPLMELIEKHMSGHCVHIYRKMKNGK
ncbi:ArsR family transcriptional regulator [Candidatus Pacearchaeota archaeon]|nr:MAG: ArsR family transcriptional regulator [Candidatus Pacearchaeota archaeon]